MKLFKHAENSNLYQIHEITEDQLIGLYGMCVDYKGYAAQLLALPKHSLKKMAPAGDVELLCESINLRIKACNDFIEFWKEAAHLSSKKSQN